MTAGGVRVETGRKDGGTARVEYVSRAPRPPLDELIDDLYYLAGAAPYTRLMLPPAPSALLIVDLGAPFRIRGGADAEAAEYADGCVVATLTRAWEFGHPCRTASVGAHVKPWGLAPFPPIPAAELRDRPVTPEQIWGAVRRRRAAGPAGHGGGTAGDADAVRRRADAAAA